MTDIIDVDALQQTLRHFDSIRDWQQFHSLKNLAISVACESGELLELFQWLSDEEINSAISKKEFKQAVGHEIADIIMYMMRISDKLDINLSQVIADKITINQRRYPAERVKGSAKKYHYY
ncbi:MAG: nucleotide pyrophosphohydrolase [Gammaproteobacteria bacterium]|nr:nucleotide pyrophosphohydrolase [Gammaproteobacteria bacterium]